MTPDATSRPSETPYVIVRRGSARIARATCAETGAVGEIVLPDGVTGADQVVDLFRRKGWRVDTEDPRRWRAPPQRRPQVLAPVQAGVALLGGPAIARALWGAYDKKATSWLGSQIEAGTLAPPIERCGRGHKWRASGAELAAWAAQNRALLDGVLELWRLQEGAGFMAAAPGAPPAAAPAAAAEAPLGAYDPKIGAAITRLLDEVYPAETRRWKAGWSDQRVAEETGASPAFVQRYRLRAYGAEAVDPAIAALRQQAAALESDVVAWAEVARSLTEAVVALRRKIDVLEAAPRS